jgi:Ca2+-binding RTX toxin-like protein
MNIYIRKCVVHTVFFASLVFANILFAGAARAETLTGTAGDDELVASDNGDWLIGAEGNDTLVGGDGNDTLDGGPGVDILNGGLGTDTYLFNIGDGQDNEIINYDITVSAAARTDALVFGVGIAPSDVRVEIIHFNNRLRFTLKNTGDFIDVDSYFYTSTDGERHSELAFAQFDDGTQWDRETFIEKIIEGTPGDDVLNGWNDRNDFMDGLAGNDTLRGHSGDDTITGGSGDDEVYGDEGDDTLSVGPGVDIVDGGEGTDTYLFNVGDGQDNKLNNYDSSITSAERDDVLRFGAGLNPTDIRVEKFEINNDLRFTIVTTGDFIDVVGHFYVTAAGLKPNELAFVAFDDGSQWDRAQFLDNALVGTPNADTIIGWNDRNDTIDGKAGNDELHGNSGDDTISGGADDDTIYGDGGDDILWGGPGVDTLTGGTGNDIYIFNLGDGQGNRINNYDASVAFAQRSDSLHFGPGLNPSDIRVEKTSGARNVRFTIISSGEYIEAVNQFRISPDGTRKNRLYQVVFENATTWSADDIDSYADGAEIPPDITVPITVTVDNAVLALDGTAQLSAPTSGTVIVAGSFANAPSGASISLQNESTVINASGTDGRFSVVLALADGREWDLSLVDNSNASNTVILPVLLVSDIDAPILSLADSDTGDTVDTDAQSIEVLGTASDTGSGIAEILIISDRYSQEFAAFIGADTQFSGEIPLEIGINNLKVIARDNAGNTTELNLLVTREIPAQPSIQLNAPLNAAVIYQANTIVEGLVYSSLPANDLRLVLHGQAITDQPFFLSEGTRPGQYDFQFNDVVLNEGSNFFWLTVESSAGDETLNFSLSYQAEQEQNEQADLAPEITLLLPKLNTQITGDSVAVSGTVSSNVGISEVSVNGLQQSLVGANDRFSSFNTSIDLSAAGEGPVSITIIAIDVLGESTEHSLDVLRDTQAPSIQIDGGLGFVPQINTVIENPYVLKGSVSDANLAGLTLNGQNVVLTPGVTSGDFNFSIPVNLDKNSEFTLLLEAWDENGNPKNESVILLSNPPATMEIISPASGESVALDNTAPSLPVTLRLVDLDQDFNAADYQVHLSVQSDSDGNSDGGSDGNSAGNSSTIATIQDGLVNETLDLTDALLSMGEATQSTVRLVAELHDIRNGTDTHVASVSRVFELINNDNAAVALERTEPENGQTGIETNAPINLYFNHVLDTALLTVDVRETSHGKAYPLPVRDGNGAALKAEPRLIDVNRDSERVPGGLSILPDGRTVAFYPKRDLGYEGQVFVDVTYDGASLGRFAYQLRSLPTFVQGGVYDTNGQKLGGLDITIPELGRSTRSDEQGAYGFGFGDSAATALPGGMYDVIYNPDNRLPGYASVIKRVRVEQGRLNSVNTVLIPVLSSSQPYRHISSGDAELSLANGELLLDLSEAEINFTSGVNKNRNSGDVHVLFTPAEAMTFNVQPSAQPSWVYSVQPPRIDVTGRIGVSMKVPAIGNDYSYLPPDGRLVLIVGQDSRTNVLSPVGVGRIENTSGSSSGGNSSSSDKWVHSVGTLPFTRLNAFAYVIVSDDTQIILQQFIDGELSESAFTAALNAANEAQQ